MKSKRTLLIRLAVVLVLIAIGAVMMVIGRGHTVYFDNVALDYNGTHYDALYKVTVYVKDKQVAKLYAKERGMATWIGQNFSMTLEVIETKGGDEEVHTIHVKLPYNMDGIVLNLPALLQGLPEEAYLKEFVSNVPEVPVEEEPGSSDEFDFGADF
ncbi:MAG: hypothetical protein GX189_04565 [Clostridiales bacterium]|nr:hypothetical protein [Clostridiales bacterium]